MVQLILKFIIKNLHIKPFLIHNGKKYPYKYNPNF